MQDDEPDKLVASMSIYILLEVSKATRRGPLAVN